MDRLQKVLASAGIGSRRQCEELIVEGRIEVDHQTVTELGVRVDPDHQVIRFDGEVVKIQRREYYVVNKPPGVLSTNLDPSGRIRVIDLINTRQRVFTVGRLDKTSEGLMIVTNDGDLAQQLTHPKYGCRKTYLVTVVGEPKIGDLEELKRGVRMSDGFARIHDFKIKKRMKTSTILEIVLKEGRNREIRRLLARTGHKVTLLRRIAIGPIRLADLPLGAHRRLDPREVKLLRQFSDADKQEKKGGGKSGGKKRKSKSDNAASAGESKPRTAKKKPASRSSESNESRRTRKKKTGMGSSSGRKKTGKRSSSSDSRASGSKASGAKTSTSTGRSRGKRGAKSTDRQASSGRGKAKPTGPGKKKAVRGRAQGNVTRKKRGSKRR